MKKILIILLTMMLGMLTLASCTGDGGQGNNPVAPPSGDSGNDPIEYKLLVRADESISLTDILNAIYEKNQKMLSITTDENMAIKGEIVFGDADRTVSEEAALMLETLIDEKGGADKCVGYVIYKDKAGNVAVVWSDKYSKPGALEKFLTDYADVELLASMAAGVVYENVIDLDAYIAETAWADIDRDAPPEVAAALKSLNKFFNGDGIADWIANLWEPYICVCGKCEEEGKEIACYGGGFYYANSARDYDTFLPDVESTSQALSLLVNLGVFENYGNSWANAVEEVPLMKEKLIAFCQSLQDEASGYFYHPQWGSTVGAARRGRDLGWATGILKSLGAEPLYPTALDRLQGKGTSAVLTSPLGGSVASKVSAVLPTASFESSLGNEEDYMKWLVEVTNGDDMFKNSSGAHTIASVSSQIIAAGYLEITLNYLDMRVEQLYTEMKAAYDADPENNPRPTGLWQRTADYNAVWGILKLSGLYTSGNRPFKYHEDAMRTCIEVVLMDADDGGNYHMNDVWNQWASCKRIISNAQIHNPDIVDALYAMAAEKALPMIEATKAKLAKFIQKDGSYGYNQGTSSPTTQGVSVSLGLPEGDVNATALAYSTYADAFSVLGYKAVKLCDFRDGERVLETIRNLTSVEKIQLGSSDPITFDEDVVGLTTTFGSGGYAEYTADPDNANNNVLKFVTMNPGGDTVGMKPFGNAMSANCFVFQADIYVESANREYLYQCHIGDSFMFDIIYKNGKVMVRANPTTAGTAHATMLNVEAPMKSWFNLRVEYYKDAALPTIKVYQDGILKAVTNNYYGSEKESATPANTYSTASIYAMNATEATIYIDNAYFACEIKELVDEEVKEEINTTTYKFDFEGSTPALPVLNSPKADKIYTVKDPTNDANTVLAFESYRTDDTAGCGAYFGLTDGTADTARKGISFDMNIASRGDLNGNGTANELVGDFLINGSFKVLYQVFVSVGSSRAFCLAVQPVAGEDGIVNGFKLMIGEGGTGSVDVEGIYSLDTVYNIKLEMTVDKNGYSSIRVIVDGTEVLVTDKFSGTSYAQNGAVSLELYALKRTRGISYFDNFEYFASEELVER